MRWSIGMVLVAALAAAAACRDTTGGDDGVNPDGGDGPDGGGGTTIYDLQMGNVAVGTSVELEGVVVTAVDLYGGRVGGIYVQEPGGGPYSGVFVFNPKGPDGTSNAADLVQPGDVVTVSGGVVDEFALSSDTSGRTLTEIVAPQGGTVIVTRTGSTQVPAPAVVDPVALAADDAEAEKWEGVLVRIESVAVVSAPRGVSMSDPTLKEMTVTGPFRVGSSLAALDGIARDDCYAAIVGIGDYFFNYKILPRSAADLAVGDASACVYENTMAMCTNGLDDDHDGFPDCADFSCQAAVPSCVLDTTIEDIQMGNVPMGTKVRVTDVVVTARASSLVWVQREGGAEYSGIAIYPSMPPQMTLVPGLRVDVEGMVTEYFGVTELASAVITEKGMGAPLAPIVVADHATLVDPATAEAWEGVLVRVENVKVVSAPDGFGEWTVGTAAAPLRVDDMMHKPMPDPMPGQCFAHVTGPLHYSFDNFKLEPRNATDLMLGAGCM